MIKYLFDLVDKSFSLVAYQLRHSVHWWHNMLLSSLLIGFRWSDLGGCLLTLHVFNRIARA